MGTWGTAIFSDDLASDIREEFKELIGDGKTPEEATEAIKKSYHSCLNDPDEKETFWIALSATQWNLGRLLPEVLEKALQVLDSGGDLHRWNDDLKSKAKRKVVLEQLRAQLTSAQPAAKKIAKVFRHNDRWPIGSVYKYALNNGDFCLMKVIDHHTDKGGISPILQILDWSGKELPDEETIRSLKVRFGKVVFTNPAVPPSIIKQFFVGSVSQREHSTLMKKFAPTGITTATEKYGIGVTVFLGRDFDAKLAKFFNLGAV